MIALQQFDASIVAPVLRRSSDDLKEKEHEHSAEHEQEIVTVAISALRPGDSPRIEGEDREHIIRLAETESPLPPIIVNRHTMQVVDGVHRVFAAVLRGETKIPAAFFDGSREDAFLFAVRANSTHGLPLSLADRRTAAERILVSHGHMSDRAIARATGLGAKTIATLRGRLAPAAPQVRVGIDGKVRPVNSVEGRRRAAQVLAERPDASLREVARFAGISPATVTDVKRRLAAGEPPAGTLHSVPEAAPQVRPAPQPAAPARGQRRETPVKIDPGRALKMLMRDPSLRHKQVGRELLRLLHHNMNVMSEWPELLDAVPQHCTRTTADLARQYAENWVKFAEHLGKRGCSAVPAT
ncbi:ParB/RepB/Spo0J family partition protein [Streptomyces brasiliensis]|uniref:ParB/RepB/Spo0J family partition protein n=1 Tax=Streptomyces brasiliensis TaxID=1954 RepID=UPI001E3F7DA3|nr:ParB N-terminal domain-containing protein [Streptomyces brasiliensis]